MTVTISEIFSDRQRAIVQDKIVRYEDRIANSKVKRHQRMNFQLQFDKSIFLSFLKRFWLFWFFMTLIAPFRIQTKPPLWARHVPKSILFDMQDIPQRKIFLFVPVPKIEYA